MKRIYRFLALLISLSFATALVANAAYSSEHLARSNADLIGAIDRTALLEPPYQSWYTNNYSSYSPDTRVLEDLAKRLEGVEVKAFMGTWCHDSQREVPRLVKILEGSNFDLSNLSLVSLSRSKDTPAGLESGLNIQRTPTFIIFKDGAEIGRIVETPRVSLENDILTIISGEEYKHSYHKEP